MRKLNSYHGPAIDAYIVPDTDEHQVINIYFYQLKLYNKLLKKCSMSILYFFYT